MTVSHDPTWPATRAEGLRRLEAFLPSAGPSYATWRNHDFGPGDRSNVSTLSPYIRHRLVLESEVVAAVLARHGHEAAGKFLQEVCWRTYWKGWLEMRPAVWREYREELERTRVRLETDALLQKRYEAAVSASTGIDCLDAWTTELVKVGYLHNHARMWYASIWIFTLRLPWVLGADFFLRHLLDGDPASNTLSWRWVAGLQTRGKTYLAEAGNIARYTSGRFPRVTGLATRAGMIDAPAPPAAGVLPRADRAGAGRVGLLLTEEDLHPESLPIGREQVVAIAGATTIGARSSLAPGEPAARFHRDALEDGLSRAGAYFEAPTVSFDGLSAEPILAWASSHEVDRIVMGYPTVGPARDAIDAIGPSLEAEGVRLLRVRRDWDDTLWPHARAGFFPFRERIAGCLTELALAR